MKARLAILTLFAALSAAAVEITSDWTIVCPEGGHGTVCRALREAGAEIAADLKEAAGLDCKVVKASAAGKPAHAIYIGAEFARAAGFDPSSLKGWDCAYAEKDGSIYCYGNDFPGRTSIPAFEWFRCVLPSVKATGHFLYDVLGVRFVMLGRVGVEVPHADRVVVRDGLSRTIRHPYLFGTSRGGSWSMVGQISNGDLPYGAFHDFGGHTYPAACNADTDFETHPEWFAMDEKGKRVRHVSRGHCPLCISNPEVGERLFRTMKEKLDDGAMAVQLGQQDGLGYCHCEKCRALYGTGDDWGEKFWIFHRGIAERLEKACPGKLVYIMSYALTALPPKSFRKFPSNVMIQMCDYSPASFDRWRSHEVPGGYLVYLYLWGNYPIPGYTPKRSFDALQDLARLLRRENVRGVYRCGSTGLEAIEGPQYYVFNRLLCDPDADTAAVLKEFCDAAYGRAGGQMRTFFTVLDRQLRDFNRVSMGHFEASPEEKSRLKAMTPLAMLAHVYEPAAVAKMQAALDAAEALPMTERQKIRFRRLKIEWAYAKNLGAIATDWFRYWEKPGAERFRPLAADVRFRRKLIDRLFDSDFRAKFQKDWSDAPLLRGDSREMVERNGRLGAIIRAPLDWDVDAIERSGIYPGDPTLVRRMKEHNLKAGLRPVTGWKPYTRPEGMVCEVRPDGRGFRFGPGPKATDLRVSAYVQEGLKPNARYRVSWFAKLADVKKTKREGGFYACISYDDVSPANPNPWVKEPTGGEGLVGTQDWTYQSAVVRMRAENPRLGFTFRILNGSGVAEVEDVTFEEIREGSGK